jgi:hypothetical protein
VSAPDGRAGHEEIEMPKFLLLQKYEGGAGCDVPMGEWPVGDIKAHIEFQQQLNAQLIASGEFVDAQGLTGPDQAAIVTYDGAGTPVVSDGPFAEAKELLAGYRMVDVESRARAIEIAAQASAAPGPGGVAIQQPIEVREVLGAPDPDA